MYTSLALMLGTAAAAMAAPTEARNSPLLFRLSMEIDDSLVSLTAVKNGTDGEIFLKAGRPSVYPGFDAHVIGETPDLALLFDIASDDGEVAQHGAKVIDVGHANGNVHPITVVSDYDDFSFGFSFSDDGRLNHKPTATTNLFLACKGVIDGEENYYLSWGNPTYENTLPEGCSITTVRKI